MGVIMKFPCPQCGLSRQFAIKGTVTEIAEQRCRRCASKITIKRVSARRKSFRAQTVFCSACGADFLFSSACPLCKAPFTGYLLVNTERPRKKIGITAKNLTEFVDWLGSRWPVSATTRIKSLPLRIRVVSIALFLILALFAAGSSYYLHRQNEQNYLKNYVLTLYGIKSGFDRGSGIGKDLAEESRRFGKPGYYPTSMVSEKLEEFKIVQSEVDRFMEHLANPPESLQDAGARLQQLYSIYKRQNSLVTAPHGSVDEYERAMKETQTNFSHSLAQFKSSLPTQVRDEIKKSGTRYNLQFLE
jgi:hypothetical protein